MERGLGLTSVWILTRSALVVGSLTVAAMVTGRCLSGGLVGLSDYTTQVRLGREAFLEAAERGESSACDHPIGLRANLCSCPKAMLHKGASSEATCRCRCSRSQSVVKLATDGRLLAAILTGTKGNMVFPE